RRMVSCAGAAGRSPRRRGQGGARQLQPEPFYSCAARRATFERHLAGAELALSCDRPRVGPWSSNVSARTETRQEPARGRIAPSIAIRSTKDKADDVSAIVEEANLRYVNSDEPGFSRRRHGRGFVYLRPGGERIRDP